MRLNLSSINIGFIKGFCVLEISYDDVSSGAANDLKQATILARQMVSEWGMSERIGPVNFQQSEEHQPIESF